MDDWWTSWWTSEGEHHHQNQVMEDHRSPGLTVSTQQEENMWTFPHMRVDHLHDSKETLMYKEPGWRTGLTSREEEEALRLWTIWAEFQLPVKSSGDCLCLSAVNWTDFRFQSSSPTLHIHDNISWGDDTCWPWRSQLSVQEQTNIWSSTASTETHWGAGKTVSKTNSRPDSTLIWSKLISSAFTWKVSCSESMISMKEVLPTIHKPPQTSQQDIKAAFTCLQELSVLFCPPEKILPPLSWTNWFTTDTQRNCSNIPLYTVTAVFLENIQHSLLHKWPEKCLNQSWNHIKHTLQ